MHARAEDKGTTMHRGDEDEGEGGATQAREEGKVGREHSEGDGTAKLEKRAWLVFIRELSGWR